MESRSYTFFLGVRYIVQILNVVVDTSKKQTIGDDLIIIFSKPPLKFYIEVVSGVIPFLQLNKLLGGQVC